MQNYAEILKAEVFIIIVTKIPLIYYKYFFLLYRADYSDCYL
jgi:hypothetical protein